MNDKLNPTKPVITMHVKWHILSFRLWRSFSICQAQKQDAREIFQQVILAGCMRWQGGAGLCSRRVGEMGRRWVGERDRGARRVGAGGEGKARKG